MIKLYKSLILPLIITVLVSCSGLRDVDTNALKLGMSKAEVEVALKKKSDNIVSASKNFNNDLIEVVKYTSLRDINTTDVFLLYFTNDKLERWELGRPERNHTQATQASVSKN